MAAPRSFNFLLTQLFNTENLETRSSHEQELVEKSVLNKFKMFSYQSVIKDCQPKLLVAEHLRYTLTSLKHLSGFYETLDSSRAWLCYWSLHSIALLCKKVPSQLGDSIVDFLMKCQHPDGGYGGGPGQYAHMATTYAAVNALCTIGTERAFKSIDRSALYRFFMRMRTREGGFTLHDGGETDIRGSYCALSSAALTNILTKELINGAAEWVVRCQSYEGGFAACPGMEAHGGYTFCGLAVLVLTKKTHLCDIKALIRWVVNRQMRFEGGFQGRTNKLVDGCYSFWQGGAFPLLDQILWRDSEEGGTVPNGLLFDTVALQEYVLLCCQVPDGGLLDKPGRKPDLYHTCYTLTGLSVAQHTPTGQKCVLGPDVNILEKTHPIFNIEMKRAERAVTYFNRISTPTTETSTT